MSEASHGRPVLVADSEFSPGGGLVLEGSAHTGSFGAVFEDDGETAYFYGLDNSRGDHPILHALHIYNAKNVTDRKIPSRAQIVWSVDGSRVALFINGHAHAAFDFVKSRGYCRSGFPPPRGDFSVEGHDWSDEVLEFFR